MKKISLKTISNTKIPKKNANNKRLVFAADYTISGLSQIFGYGGFSKTSILGKVILGLMEKLAFWKGRNEPQAVTIRAKPGKSGGAVTIYYEGTDGTAYPKSAAAPSAIGKYAVTFDVAAAAEWEAATGLSAGTLEINIPVFTSIAAFRAWLSAQPANTADTAYTVALNMNIIRSTLKTTLNNAANKYVCLDLSGSTFTSIGNCAFSGCASLKSVTIGKSVKSIGDYAFSECYSLASVTIGNGVTSIGHNAFYGCANLASITIGNGVGSIWKYTFEYTSLKSVTIRKGVKSIMDAFNGRYFLESVTIGNGVTSIGHNAFYGCSELKSVTIGKSVENIGEGAFSCCSSLTGVTIPGSVKNIGDDAFSCCEKLKSVTIEDGVEKIGTEAFSECSSLTGVTIPDSVKFICGDAFSYCTSLKSVIIGNGVENIWTDAFSGCSKLKSVTIGKSVEKIGEEAFSDCTSLTGVTIPDSVWSIMDYAFDGCTSLTSVTFQGTITSGNFGEFVFPGDLRDEFLAGGIGTYTRPNGESETWTKVITRSAEEPSPDLPE